MVDVLVGRGSQALESMQQMQTCCGITCDIQARVATWCSSCSLNHPQQAPSSGKVLICMGIHHMRTAWRSFF